MGVAAAYWLSRAGVGVHLFEASALSAGATGRNAGLMLNGGSPLEDPALLDAVRAEEGLHFEYARPGHLALSSKPAVWDRVQQEVRTRPASASPLYALNLSSCEDLLHTRISRSFYGGRWYPAGGVVHPARLVHELARAAVKHSASIHCRTRVVSVGTSAGGAAIVTDRGVVTANHVIHAAASASAALLPELNGIVTPVRAQMMATKPIRHMFDVGLGVDWGDVYGRQLSDGRFVLGGCGADRMPSSSDPAAESTDTAIQSRLSDFLPGAFPEFPDFTVSQRWAGLLDCTADGKPLIGAHPGRPNHWLIAGFNGHGMPVAIGAAKALAESVRTGSAPKSLEVFNPGRFESLRRPQ
jgi:glycine/D-amino acid oxidase-like deaminating enzyme